MRPGPLHELRLLAAAVGRYERALEREGDAHVRWLQRRRQGDMERFLETVVNLHAARKDMFRALHRERATAEG